MPSPPTREYAPSATFVGGLLGIGCAVFVPPRMMLTPEGTIGWLLVWPAAGLLAGAVVEAIIGSTHKRRPRGAGS